jgi:hypothetical protein
MMQLGKLLLKRYHKALVCVCGCFLLVPTPKAITHSKVAQQFLLAMMVEDD